MKLPGWWHQSPWPSGEITFCAKCAKKNKLVTTEIVPYNCFCSKPPGRETPL